MEGAAAKVRVNEEEVEVGVRRRIWVRRRRIMVMIMRMGSSLFNIKVAITDRPVARVCRGGTKMMLVNLRQSKLIGVF